MREFDFDELDRAVHSVLGPAATPVSDENGTSNDSMTSLFDEQVKKDEANAAAVSKLAEVSQHNDSRDQRISSHAIHSRVKPAARQSVHERPALRRHQPSGFERDTQKGDEVPPVVSSTVVSNTPSEQPPSQAMTGPQPRPRPLARRRAGRFMDFVHPSSDMRTAPNTAKSNVTKEFSRPIKSTNLDMTTVAPTASVSQEKIKDTSKVAPLGLEPAFVAAFDTPAPTEPVSPEPVATLFREAVAPRYQPHRERDAPALRQSPVVSEPVQLSDAIAAQESPFVTDAQVHKRPLGGSQKTTQAPDESDKQLPPEQNGQTDDIQEKIRQIESMDFSTALKNEAYLATPSPEVPKSDILNKPSSVSTEDPMPAVSASEPSVQRSSERLAQNTASKTPDSSASQSMASGLSGPTSITRQYKTEPRVASADDTSPIFDPESYHQPLEHEPKHKSGWGLVIGILLLIVVGGAIAAFLWWSGVLAVPL